MEKEQNKFSFAPVSADSASVDKATSAKEAASAGKKASAAPSEVPKERRTEDKEKKEESLEETKKKLEECQKLKDEYLNGWQRERADFLNYKREELERVEEILKYADVGLISNILPILDNFETAEKNLPEDLKGNENVEGLLQIKRQIQDFLKSQGIEEIKSMGERFDPNFHEVVEEVEVKDKQPGIIIEEIQKGYKLHGKVLRPARVKTSK